MATTTNNRPTRGEVIDEAMRRQRLTDHKVCKLARLRPTRLRTLRDGGDPCERELERLAVTLRLDVGALV